MKQRILVTGASGKVGRYLLDHLAKNQDYDIVGIYHTDKPLENYPKNVRFVKVDLQDPKATEKLFQGIDYCFHLASKIQHLRTAKLPDVFAENVAIHTNVFRAAARQKIKRIIYLSSLAIFSGQKNKSPKEDGFWAVSLSQSSYTASKMIGEYYCYTYWKEQQLPFTVVRIFAAPFGYLKEMKEKDAYIPIHDELIQDIFHKKSPIRLPITGKEKKGVLHLVDYADVLARCMRQAAKNQIIHIGSKDNLSLEEFAHKVSSVIGLQKEPVITWTTSLQMNSASYTIDNKRAKDLLGWEQQVSLKLGIQSVLDHL